MAQIAFQYIPEQSQEYYDGRPFDSICRGFTLLSEKRLRWVVADIFKKDNFPQFICSLVKLVDKSVNNDNENFISRG